MRNFKNAYDLNDQKEENVKKSQKHDANLQKNSTIYFQVGLIVCLLFSYGLLEMQFETKSLEVGYAIPLDIDDDLIDINYVIEEPLVIKEPVPIEKVKKAKLVDVYTTVANDTPDAVITEVVVEDPPIVDNPVVAIVDVPNVKEPDPIIEIPLDFVEIVPVFPGCESATTNEERKACMSEKIGKHIQKKFDTDIASDLGLEGIQQINVMFKIDRNGNVTSVQARSAHKELEDEAKEVIGDLPKMTPGKQKDKNVSVIYGIPIKFSVQN
ncbi:energy transducer TonB [Oceanihabitans sp. 2_MG-2023]|uniref:energy transducer TonB n=1 Tax=Oceanihabitans sp. 2_MG-2023 TaxID=3062661 RepID=UPI0026E152AB|nr:energy transducer TonB [Oceanihabitans sp. 2_MG-2023]MDO6596353.1 energy transducer TonB [Oceanihabitans sp. 2_MG-2023]